jgi:hypothetical protein
MSSTLDVTRPGPEEYAPSFGGYVALVPDGMLFALLASQPEELRDLAAKASGDGETSRYAPGKWSVREVVGHLGDGERTFGYRALCVSRGERQELPGFDENQYVAESGFAAQPLSDLVEELAVLRSGNLALLRRLDDSTWRRTGTANGAVISVRALAYIMAGHVAHHLEILRSRYGLT